MKFFALIFLVIILAFVSCKRTTGTLTEEEVIKVIKSFDDGWRTKNLYEVDAALAPGYIYFTRSGGTFSRDSVVQTAGSPSYTLDSMVRKEFFVQLQGNTAIVSTRWIGKGMYRGVAFDEDQRCSIVVTKINNRVEILSEHCTPIKAGAIFH